MTYFAHPLDPVPEYTPAGDRLRAPLAAFCKAVLLARCNDAWDALGSGLKVVEDVSYNDPSDNTFSCATLPAVFVYRLKERRKFERIADNIWRRTTSVVILWIPQPAVQWERADREGFFDAAGTALLQALSVGRSRYWVADGETDGWSLKNGSSLLTATGLSRPLELGDYGVVDVSIEMGDGSPARGYEAMRITVVATEEFARDPALYSTAATTGTGVVKNPPDELNTEAREVYQFSQAPE